MKWPEEQPKSVVEAVLSLDNMSNDYTKHLFKICPPLEFHFGFAMGIRNEWIYNGSDELNYQLTKKLKLNPDGSSGLILLLYQQYLLIDTIDIMGQLNERINADSMKTVKEEFQRIESDLNKEKNSWFKPLNKLFR